MKDSKRSIVYHPYIMSDHPDPYNIAFSGDWLASFHLWSTLIDIAEDGSVVPILVEKWSQSSDGKTWQFTLRPKLRWSDGSPMTGEQILQSLHFSLKGTSHTDLSQVIRDIKLQGETVIFQLTQTLPHFLHALSYIDWAIIHPDTVDLHQRKVISYNPVSGPFKLNTFSYKEGDSKVVAGAKFVRNEYLSPAFFGLISEGEIRYASNCQDIINNHSQVLTARLFRDDTSDECINKLEQLNFVVTQAQPTWVLKADFTEKGLSRIDLNLRLALIYKLQQLLRTQYQSFGVSRSTGLRGAHLYGSLSLEEFDQTLENFDPSVKGQDLSTLELSIVTMQEWSRWKSYQWLVQAVRGLGIKLKTEELSKSEFFSKYIGGVLTSNFDLLFIPLGAGDLDPDGSWRIAQKYSYGKIITDNDLHLAYLEEDIPKRGQRYKNLAVKLLVNGQYITLGMNSDTVIKHKSITNNHVPSLRNGISLYDIGR